MFKKVLSLSMTLVLLLAVLSVGLVLNTSAVSFTTMSSTDVETVATKHEGNLLAGLIPVLTGTTHINNADTLSRVTDGVAGGGGDLVAEIRPFQGADAHATGNVTFYFDMGEVKEFNQVLLAGNSSLVKKRYLYNGKVYVGNDPETLFADANLALNHQKAMASVDPFLLFDLSDSYSGQYVGFSFYHPSASECNWSDYWGGYASVTELGVYNVNKTVTIGMTSVSGDNVLEVHDENLLAGLVPVLTGTTHINDATTLSRVSDGAVDAAAEIRPFSGADAHATGNVTFYFDLGEAKTINQILLAGRESLAKKRYLYNGKVYVGNDPEALFTDANLALNHQQTMGTVDPYLFFTLNGNYTGQYVGFSIYHPSAEQCGWSDYWNGYASVAELAAYYDADLYKNIDVATSIPTDTNLIAGKTAIPAAGASIQGDIAHLTDGSIEANNVASADTGSDNNGTAEFAFKLDNATEIEKLFIASQAGETKYYLYDSYVYVSDSLEGLYSGDNLVVNAKYGYNKAARCYTYTLDEPVTGTYVGFAFSVSSTNNEWWWRARVAELGVYGTEHVQVNNGAQVRNATATDNFALRFSFDVYNTGVAYANETPQESNDYTGDLTNAYIKLAGKSYKLKAMGAIVSSTDEFGEELTKEDTGNGYTVDVPAVNLYNVAEGVVTYTAVVTQIPAAYADTPIYAASYITYETDEGDVTVYGDVISRTVSGVLAEANA